MYVHVCVCEGWALPRVLLAALWLSLPCLVFVSRHVLCVFVCVTLSACVSRVAYVPVARNCGVRVSPREFAFLGVDMMPNMTSSVRPDGIMHSFTGSLVSKNGAVACSQVVVPVDCV